MDQQNCDVINKHDKKPEKIEVVYIKDEPVDDSSSDNDSTNPTDSSKTVEVKYKCDYCSYTTHHKSTYVNHLRVHSNTRPFKCKVCLKGFKQGSHLREHLTVHTDKEKTHKCNQCKFSTHTIKSLKRHLKGHLAALPKLECAECGARFRRNEHLVSDSSAKHGIKREFACTICGFTMCKVSELNAHMVTHTSIEKYKCEKCKFVADVKDELLEHEKVHNADDKYECELCLAKFSFLRRYESHIQQHEGFKPYQCEKCPYRANRWGNLKRHQRAVIHNNFS